MEVVGYVIIKSSATTGISAAPINEFLNIPIRVFEFSKDGSVLLINSKSNALATFDACDILTSFKCGQHGIVITPPNLNSLETMMYANNALARKGGYNEIVRSMVIASSLHRGAFSDSFLWSKQ